MRLTPAGSALIQHAKGIAADFDQAERALQELYHGDLPRIVIAAGPSWERRILPSALARILTLHPKLKLEIASGSKLQLLNRVQSGEVDVFFTSMSPETNVPGLAFEPLTFDTLVICARIGHPLTVKPPQALEEMDAFGWILQGQTQNARQLLDSLYVSVGRSPPERVIEGTSATMNLNVVRETDLLSVVTSRAFAVENRNDLAEIYFPPFAATRRAGMSYRAGAVLTPAVQLLMEEMRKRTKIDGRN